MCKQTNKQRELCVLSKVEAKGGEWDEVRREWTGSITASSYDSWLGALFLCVPLCIVTDRVFTALQMFLIFGILRRILEINVSWLVLSDRSYMYIFIMSSCLVKLQA